MMMAIGFVCFVLGLFIMKAWGTHILKRHNGYDYVGAFFILGGLLSFILGIGAWLWRYAP